MQHSATLLFAIHRIGWHVANAVSLQQEKDPLLCKWNSQQHRFWQLFCCNRDAGIGDLVLMSINFNCFSAVFAFGSHALNKANLFVLKRTQIPSCIILSVKSECLQRFKPLVDSHSAKTDSFDWNSSLLRFYHRFYRYQKGLGGVHSDKSAASICKLKQSYSQQPSCLPYIVLDDRSPVKV